MVKYISILKALISPTVKKSNEFVSQTHLTTEKKKGKKAALGTQHYEHPTQPMWGIGSESPTSAVHYSHLGRFPKY